VLQKINIARGRRFVVAFESRRSKSKTKTAARGMPGQAQRVALFGPPLLLEGEEHAAYDELSARVRTTVKPADILDEIFVADIVFLQGEVLRWRRLKWALMETAGLEALECFLIGPLESNYDEEHFKSYLAEIFQNNLPEDQAESAEELAAECAANNAAADKKLSEVLGSIGLNMARVLDNARACKAKELVHEYVRREPDAVILIDELLTDAGMSMDHFMAEALEEKLGDIERIDRLTAIAESRRNACLHEIDRRRAALGQTLRRSIQEIEDAEFKVIETTQVKRKSAA
jgi:hypothetical protein